MFKLSKAGCVFMSYWGFSIFWQGAGTDESCLIEILSSRSNADILEINNIYKAGEFIFLIINVVLYDHDIQTVNSNLHIKNV